MSPADRPSEGTASSDNAPLESPSESPTPARKHTLLPFGGLGRGLAIAAIIAATLFWVFTNADTVSVSELQHYSRLLRDFRQVDTQTNADVLAISFELHKNYDLISWDTNRVNALLKQLHSPPAFLSESDIANLLHHLNELDQLVQTKHSQIEIFIRESAILRNSVRYSPTAIKQFTDSSPPPRLRSELLTLSNNVMTYLVTSDAELLSVIFNQIESIPRENANLSPHLARELGNVLDHINIVVKTKQAVISKLYVITRIPTDTELEKIFQAYNIGLKNAIDRSHGYRVLLFASALLLTLYLMLFFIRLGQATQDLQKSNHNLEQRIGELHHTQANLNLYATLFNSAAEGMLIADANSRVLVANPAFTAITGYSVEEIQTRSPSLLSSGRHAKPFYQEMWKTIEQRGKWQGEIWNRRKNGEMYPEWLSIAAVYDAAGNATHYIGVFSDITERKKSEAHIQHLSLHDPLTNLPNRLLMQEKLNEALAQSQRINSHTAVLFVNLDRFRNINDTLGNELGDALLQQVAHRSQSLLRDTDTVSRLGSDEFVFILPDINQP
ncbi:MAG: diguanylate cyclase, partial [Azoarcus sp.]|nr:diguanylate cyclase [Azoarcus sp.]